MKKTVIASALALLVSTQVASANTTLNDQLSFRFGPFFPSIDTKLSINGGKYDFEDVLDDNATTGSVQALWRFSRKWRLRFGYWAVDRDTSESLSQSESIGGITIPAGSSVAASFDNSYLSGAIGYSFVRSDTTEFGADIGLSGLGVKSELGASVTGLGSVSFTAFDETYLLPTIGLYINQALSPHWSISGRLGGIGLDLGDDFKGTVVEGFGAVEYRPWQNFGFGLAYVYNSADATLKNVGRDGTDVEWKYQGPFAYLTIGFGKAP
jgi:hypothetical protein